MSNISLPGFLGTTTGKLTVVVTVFIVVISTIIIFGVSLSTRYRQQAQDKLAQSLKAPQEAVKSQVKKVLYKHIDEDGNIRYVEILLTGHINIYDENFNLIKSGIQGFARIDNLMNYINDHLDEFVSQEGGQSTLTIETNQGTITINLDDDLGDIIDDIIDEIEDIVDDTFSPTPTPIPPPPTLTPGGPSLTPTPTSPLIPSLTPTAIPFGPTPTPTPLPDYMTAPPFTCEDYKYLNRPITISNVICGAD